ncbi:hypothetical protein STEG23_026053 [Scotinomys teguina]
MPALSRKGDELFLRWLSDPETEPALQDWLWQIQSEITHLLVMLGSKVKRREDFVVFQQYDVIVQYCDDKIQYNDVTVNSTICDAAKLYYDITV